MTDTDFTDFPVDELPMQRRHIFITLHATPVMSVGLWGNTVEHVKQIVTNIPTMSWPDTHVYGPSNERYGPGSLCVETVVDDDSFTWLVGQFRNLPEWFTCRVDIAEVN